MPLPPGIAGAQSSALRLQAHWCPFSGEPLLAVLMVTGRVGDLFIRVQAQFEKPYKSDCRCRKRGEARGKREKKRTWLRVELQPAGSVPSRGTLLECNLVTGSAMVTVAPSLRQPFRWAGGQVGSPSGGQPARPANARESR